MINLIITLILYARTSAAVVCQKSIEEFNADYSDQLGEKDFRSLINEKAEWLGEGSFGQVSKIPWDDPNNSIQFAAVKMSTGNQMEAFENEKNILNMLHENKIKYIPDFYACLSIKGFKFLIMEFIDRSLEPFIKNPKTKKDMINPNYGFFYNQPSKMRLKYYSQMAWALHELHNNKLVHHDVKPANWMLKEISKEEFEIRLIDFASVKEEGEGFGTGSVYYYDPDKVNFFYNKAISKENKDAIKNRKDQKKADIWALAVTIFILENGLIEETWNLLSNPDKPMLEDIKTIMGAATLTKWMAERELNVCTTDKKVCFHKILANMLKMNRDERNETAQSLAEQFSILSKNGQKFEHLVEKEQALGGFANKSQNIGGKNAGKKSVSKKII